MTSARVPTADGPCCGSHRLLLAGKERTISPLSPHQRMCVCVCEREREREREREGGRGRAYHSSDRETSRWEQVGLLALQPRTVSAVPPVPAGASATQGDRIAVPPGQVVFSNSKLRLKLDEENTAVGRDPRGTPGRSTSSSTCDDSALGLTEVAWHSVREEISPRKPWLAAESTYIG